MMITAGEGRITQCRGCGQRHRLPIAKCLNCDAWLPTLTGLRQLLADALDHAGAMAGSLMMASAQAECMDPRLAVRVDLLSGTMQQSMERSVRRVHDEIHERCSKICTFEDHDWLRAQGRGTWEVYTLACPGDGAGLDGLEIRNCIVCHGTLSRPVTA